MGANASAEEMPVQANSSPNTMNGRATSTKMKVKKCLVDPKLSKQKGRKAPPVNAKNCKKGSLTRGMDGKSIYKMTGTRWVKVCGEKEKECQKLFKTVKPLKKTPQRAVKSPKRKQVKKSEKKKPMSPKPKRKVVPKRKVAPKRKATGRKVAPKRK